MSRRRPEFYVLLWAGLLVVVTAFLLLARPLSSPRANPKPNLDLKVSDQNGRMRVDWDATSPAIQTAQGATLEVEDGGAFNRYPVEPDILKSGGLEYVRRSQDVLLTLTLYHDGRPGLQSSIRRIAPIEKQVVVAPASTPPRPKPQRRQSRARRR